MNGLMKEYEIMYRMRYDDYPEYEHASAVDEYDAIVEFFNILKPIKPEQIEIIKLEVL